MSFKNRAFLVSAVLVFTVLAISTGFAAQGLFMDTPVDQSTQCNEVTDQTAVPSVNYTINKTEIGDNSMQIVAEYEVEEGMNDVTVTVDDPATDQDVNITDWGQFKKTGENKAKLVNSTSSTIVYTVSVDRVRDSNRFISSDTAFLNFPAIQSEWVKDGTKYCSDEPTEHDMSLSAANSTPYDSVVYSDSFIHASGKNLNVTTYEIDGQKIITVAPITVDKTEMKKMMKSISKLETELQDSNGSIYVNILEYSRSGGATMTYKDETVIWISKWDYRVGKQSTSQHEWVHAKENAEFGSNMTWANEALAEYIGIYTNAQTVGNYDAAVDNNIDTDDEWYGYPSRTTDSGKLKSEYLHMELSNESTWEGNINYYRGAKVFFLIDTAFENHSNNGYTVIDLINWMNDQEGTITYDKFRQKIVSETDEQFGERLDQYVHSESPIDVKEEYGEITGNSTPKIPNRNHDTSVDKECDVTIESADDVTKPPC